MPQTVRIASLTLAAVFLVLVIAGLVFIYSGQYNVAATAQHTSFGSWVLGTLKRRSIRTHAAALDIDIPAIGGAQLEAGIQHFAEMCVPCHGAPGVERGEYGKGMTPTPPDLAKVAGQWSPDELFWIVKHGVKLSGMPAFGPTHSDEEIWGIVSFLQQLPHISPDEYRRVTGGTAPSHSHDETPADEPVHLDEPSPPEQWSPP